MPKKIGFLLPLLLLLSATGTRAVNALTASDETGFVDVSAGEYHTCAIYTYGDSDRGYCWGDNNSGQLGNGTLLGTVNPTNLGLPLTTASLAKIEAGNNSTCAITATSGRLYCWGDNTWGQIGDGTRIDAPYPVLIDGGALSGKIVIDVAFTGVSTCALTLNGSVACWGSNSGGEIGDGTTEDRLTPTLVNGGALASKRVRNLDGGFTSMCATTRSSQLVCWGWGSFDGEDETLLPVRINNGYLRNKRVLRGAAGPSYCAMTAKLRLACWGDNERGETGTGSGEPEPDPKRINRGSILGKSIIDISMSRSSTTCVVTGDERLSCWGSNTRGQLGTGDRTSTLIPTAIRSGALRGKDVLKVSTGYRHTCAVIENGDIACWGDNRAGQLGHGNETDSLTPRKVTFR